MKLFILEDNPNRIALFKTWFRGHDVDQVDTADTAIKLLKEKKYDLILLDHDLGGDEMVDSREYNTGYTVAKAIPTTINKNTQAVVHSHNPVGSVKMVTELVDNDVVYKPFGSFSQDILKLIKHE